MCLVLNKAEEHAVFIHISDRLSFISELSLALHKLRVFRKQIYRNILVTVLQHCAFCMLILSFTFCKCKRIPFQLQGKSWSCAFAGQCARKRRNHRGSSCTMGSEGSTRGWGEYVGHDRVQTQGITRRKDLAQADGYVMDWSTITDRMCIVEHSAIPCLASLMEIKHQLIESSSYIMSKIMAVHRNSPEHVPYF